MQAAVDQGAAPAAGARSGNLRPAVPEDEGNTLSRRVANDEPELLKLLVDVLELAGGGHVTWALDLTGGEPGLLIAMLGWEARAVQGLPVG